MITYTEFNVLVYFLLENTIFQYNLFSFDEMRDLITDYLSASHPQVLHNDDNITADVSIESGNLCCKRCL